MGISTTVEVETEVAIEPRLARKAMIHLKIVDQLQETIREAKEALVVEVATIEKIREVVGVKSFALNGFKVTRVFGDLTKLDRKKMKAAGVTDAQFTDWSTTKAKKAFTKVTAPGAKPDVFEEED